MGDKVTSTVLSTWRYHCMHERNLVKMQTINNIKVGYQTLCLMRDNFAFAIPSTWHYNYRRDRNFTEIIQIF